MATVRELSAPYGNFMVGPRHGPEVCRRCFNFTDGYDYCYTCTRQPNVLDAVAPISYSVGHEQLHHSLASYKRLDGVVGRRLTLQLAAVLWRYLASHETCVAQAARLSGFSVVTTVPSGNTERDEQHPLRPMVAETVGVTRSRYRRLLRPTAVAVAPRAFSREKFRPTDALSGESVLLIDDTWTTGANAQSAAAALKAAGAGRVAAVVIGRHVNRDWHQNDQRLRRLGVFHWEECALCAPARAASAVPPVPA